jgi:hypothetical protein
MHEIKFTIVAKLLNCLQHNHQYNKTENSQENRSKYPNKLKCYNCQEFGHCSNECSVPVSNLGRKSKPLDSYSSVNTIQSASKNSKNRLYVPCKINNEDVKALLDTGVDSTVINYETFKRTKCKASKTPYNKDIYGVDGRVKAQCWTDIVWNIDGQQTKVKAVVLSNLKEECLLGMDVIKRHPKFKPLLRVAAKVTTTNIQDMRSEPRIMSQRSESKKGSFNRNHKSNKIYMVFW